MIIDSHCHLHDSVYRDFHDIIGRAVAHNVWGVVGVGSDPETNLKTLDLANRYSKVVWPCLGLHPERIQLNDEACSRVEQQLIEHHSRIVAVGEVGLPWYCLEGVADVAAIKRNALTQLDRLSRLAKRFDLPLVLHAPHGAAVEALGVLRRAGVDRAVFHWHKAPLEVTREILGAGYFISVTPEVTYRERDQELVRHVPIQSLLVESDGPWPFQGEFSGQVTEPWMASRVVEVIAKLKGLPLEETTIQISANTCDFFDLT
jgi:TatD DNase family protein